MAAPLSRPCLPYSGGGLILAKFCGDSLSRPRSRSAPRVIATRGKRMPSSHAQRPEWNCVGLLGQLSLRKGQPVAPTWVKIKDISDEVELWLVK